MTYRSSRWRALFATFAALALVATSCGGSSTDAAVETADSAESAVAQPSTESAPEETPTAVEEPSLIANTVSGSQIDFGSLEGQDVVLWFWAPW